MFPLEDGEDVELGQIQILLKSHVLVLEHK
jgi:hypothetical protein